MVIAKEWKWDGELGDHRRDKKRPYLSLVRPSWATKVGLDDAMKGEHYGVVWRKNTAMLHSVSLLRRVCPTITGESIVGKKDAKALVDCIDDTPRDDARQKFTFAPLYNPRTLPRSLRLTALASAHTITSSIARNTLTPGRCCTSFCSCTFATLNGKDRVLMQAPSTAPLRKSFNLPVKEGSAVGRRI